MGILTIYKRINRSSLKFYRSQLTRKIYSSGSFFLVKHFEIEWEKGKLFRIKAPLLNIEIGSYKIPLAPNPSKAEVAIRNDPRTRFFAMNSNLEKRAHSSVLVNKNRQYILKFINQHLKMKNHNTISILFLKPSAFASPEQILEQVRQAVNKYMNQPNTIKSISASKSFSSILNPFNIDIWQNYSLLKNKNQSLRISQNRSLNAKELSICLCHYYRIKSSKNELQFNQDLSQLKKMVQKFNFFAALHAMNIDNKKAVLSNCRKLVRVLKWRTLETEQYLIFLLNQFGHENIPEILNLFKQVYSQLTFDNKTNSKLK